MLPQILFAPDSAAANALLDKWVVGFGAVADCTTCASLSEADLYMKPELKWISDEKLLGSDFSKDLQKILRNRPSSGNSFLCLTGRGHRQSSL